MCEPQLFPRRDYRVLLKKDIHDNRNMAPKKGGRKAQDDDWENEVAEIPDSIAQPTEDSKAGDEVNPDEEFGGGGLLAALKKNKNKKAKKGKPANDYLDGETATPDGAATPTAAEVASKAPAEASLDDDDAPAAKSKKGKGGKQGQKQEIDDEADEDDGGKVKSKKEKEKEKKEREKQRKKEQV